MDTGIPRIKCFTHCSPRSVRKRKQTFESIKTQQGDIEFFSPCSSHDNAVRKQRRKKLCKVERKQPLVKPCTVILDSSEVDRYFSERSVMSRLEDTKCKLETGCLEQDCDIGGVKSVAQSEYCTVKVECESESKELIVKLESVSCCEGEPILLNFVQNSENIDGSVEKKHIKKSSLLVGVDQKSGLSIENVKLETELDSTEQQAIFSNDCSVIHLSSVKLEAVITDNAEELPDLNNARHIKIKESMEPVKYEDIGPNQLFNDNIQISELVPLDQIQFKQSCNPVVHKSTIIVVENRILLVTSLNEESSDMPVNSSLMISDISSVFQPTNIPCPAESSSSLTRSDISSVFQLTNVPCPPESSSSLTKSDISSVFQPTNVPCPAESSSSLTRSDISSVFQPTNIPCPAESSSSLTRSDISSVFQPTNIPCPPESSTSLTRSNISSVFQPTSIPCPAESSSSKSVTCSKKCKKSVKQRKSSVIPLTKTTEEMSREKIEDFYNHICKYHINSSEKPSIHFSQLVQIIDDNYNGTVNCLQCTCTFDNGSSFIKHYSTTHTRHKKGPIICCKICKKSHRNIGKITYHLMHTHTNYWNHFIEEDSTFCCLTCERLFTDKEVMVLKNIELSRFYLRNLGKLGFKYKLLSDSIPINNKKRFSCQLCKPLSYFDSEQNFNEHFKSHLTDFVFKTCRNCNNIFHNIDSFYFHCELCVQSTQDWELNFDHRKLYPFYQILVVKEKKVCTECSLEFVNNCSYKLHMIEKHCFNHFLKILLPKTVNMCLICKVVLKDPKLFLAHCVPFSVLSSRIPLFCHECNTIFTSTEVYHQHTQLEHRSLQCKVCSVKMESAQLLDEHICRKHSNQLIHCTWCTSNVKVEVNHFKSCPTDSLVCPICGFVCDSFDLLIEHINIDINLMSLYQYQCKHCLNYFFTQFNLCAHIYNTKCGALLGKV